MDDKEIMKNILRSIDAIIVFHNKMMEFFRNKLPEFYDQNITVITHVDDENHAPVAEERKILDRSLPRDDPPETRHAQLLHLVEEFYV